MMKFSTVLVMMLATVEAWSFGTPSRYTISLLNEIPVMDTPFARLLRESDRMMDRALSMRPFASPTQSAPLMMPYSDAGLTRYEVLSNEREFKVALDVPGVHPDDVHVEFDSEQNMLRIKGSREAKGDGYSFSSAFSQSFSIDPAVDIDKVSAKLENGVLLISAPNDLKTPKEEKVRKIPVMLLANEGESTVEVEKNATTVDVNETESEDFEVLDLDA